MRIKLESPLTAAELIEIDNARYVVPASVAAILRELTDASEKADQEFRSYAPLFGIHPDACGVEFTSHGKTFRLTGFALNNSKYPILAVETAGQKRSMKFTREASKAINASMGLD